MSAKSNTSKRVRIGVVISSIALAVFLFLRSSMKDNPEGTIKRIFSRSKYKTLVPYIVKLAKMETGGFTSNLYLNYNNLFGMGVRKRWPQERLGEVSCEGGTRSCATYKDHAQSVEDLLYWFERHNDRPEAFDQNDRTFVEYLKSKGYFTANVDDYYNAFHRW